MNGENEKGRKQTGGGDDVFFDFFAFLVTSARGSLEEGVFTASLRLIDAASRLADLARAARIDKEDDGFLAEMQSQIRAGMTSDYLGSEERYVAFLDSILEKLAAEVRRRNNL
jgi:hypothetical protein